MAQPPFPLSGQQQFPAGPELIRNGLVSPRDGVFNETPPGSTRSLSPDNAQMGRKRGRRPKSKLDVDITEPVSAVNSPSSLVPRPGPESVPEQQALAKKRGRKPKVEPEVSQRNWNVGAHDPHRQSFGHADALVDSAGQDPTGHFTAGDESQLSSGSSHHMETDHGHPTNGNPERSGQDVTHQDKRYLEDDAGRRYDPQLERQRQPFDDMSNRPLGNFPPGSVEEFERIQRLRQQQEQRQPEQHLQPQQHPEQYQQQYPHPQQAPGSPKRYENDQGHPHALEPHSGHAPVEPHGQCSQGLGTKGDYNMAFQGDGNLIYDVTGKAIWASGTYDECPDIFRIKTEFWQFRDGHMYISNKAGRAAWATVPSTAYDNVIIGAKDQLGGPSRFVLDAGENKSGWPTKLSAWKTDKPEQRWNIFTDGTIRNKYTNQCIYVQDSENGSIIYTTHACGDAKTIWQFPGDGSIWHRHTGKCLDNRAQQLQEGNPIQLWECYNPLVWSEKWHL
ncbi:hypothetical protein BGZ96_004296 [Linnemannia gamsii]|uniref:Ricin B lectin domain-containing protein n=1 Tax=Linnemannia gamsii TaxID=64522 RepID=A0ABQ7K747_9FUNG|nr:hypothetical protein BGZ96_004296 [Linnemannia gamsii]